MSALTCVVKHSAVMVPRYSACLLTLPGTLHQDKRVSSPCLRRPMSGPRRVHGRPRPDKQRLGRGTARAQREHSGGSIGTALPYQRPCVLRFAGGGGNPRKLEHTATTHVPSHRRTHARTHTDCMSPAPWRVHRFYRSSIRKTDTAALRRAAPRCHLNKRRRRGQVIPCT